MSKYCKSLLLLIIINSSWSSDSNITYESKQYPIINNPMLMNYSNFPVFTSKLPRSWMSSTRTNINFIDFIHEKELLDEKYDPLDLGEGSPNYLPSQPILNALVEVAVNQTEPGAYANHQYTRTYGEPRLVNIVAKFYSYLMKRNLDPMREVLITGGTTNSLDLAARAFINPGDEVVVFEPFFFMYRSQIRLSGGKIVTVPLRIKNGCTGKNSNDWSFDRRELESKINKKTKIIWLNNPNNPLGKAYTLEELTLIGQIAIKRNLIILSDEAAQWYIYDKPDHIRIGSLPGLFGRTITLTSGGELFTNTGWRIGWIIAPEPLLWPIASILQNNLVSVSTPLQIAYAIGMEIELKRWGTPKSYFIHIKNFLTRARDRLVSILRSVGADVITPTAGYCVTANFTRLVYQIDLSSQTDYRPGFKFWKYMLIKKGISAYPMSIFYDEKNMSKTEYSLRFTNIKTMQTFDEFETLLANVFKKVKTGYFDEDDLKVAKVQDQIIEVSTNISLVENTTMNTNLL